MNELRYQLDLMRAMNQKLSDREKMYRLLCDTMDYAYIYYSFEKNTVTTLGKWDDFFDFHGVSFLFSTLQTYETIFEKQIIFIEIR